MPNRAFGTGTASHPRQHGPHQYRAWRICRASNTIMRQHGALPCQPQRLLHRRAAGHSTHRGKHQKSARAGAITSTARAKTVVSTVYGKAVRKAEAFAITLPVVRWPLANNVRCPQDCSLFVYSTRIVGRNFFADQRVSPTLPKLHTSLVIGCDASSKQVNEHQQKTI